jgi:hypothetical protein
MTQRLRRFTAERSGPVRCGSGAVVLALLLLGSALAISPTTRGAVNSPAASSQQIAATAFANGPRAPVHVPVGDGPSPGSHALGPAEESSIPILVTFDLSNQSSLGALLEALSDPHSTLYHHFLTAAEFDARYAPSASFYQDALRYFETYGVQEVTTYADRLSIGFETSAATAGSIFGATLDEYGVSGRSYYAPSTVPELPGPLAAEVSQVLGLSSYPNHLLTTNLHMERTRDQTPEMPNPTASPEISGYLPPALVGGTQYEYAPDFQVAYDEQSLFAEYGYPSNVTVASILWSGNYTGPTTTTTASCGSQTITNNEAVGPFDPPDVSAFFNETLPSGEPHPSVTAVPIEGAAGASCRASWDTSGAVGENTLDLEMVGSTAPGAQIYNVYGPNATSVFLDDAFNYILNPLSTPGLANVRVITNSWGGPDGNDTMWYDDLEEAQARGISVLASSGDSDDSTSSSKYVNTPPAQVEFPSSMAYDAFGVTAVGGTTARLGPGSLEVATQDAWVDNFPSHGGGPLGSTGGISTVFPEPSWQRNTEASSVITTPGRGTPDIAALANRTLLTITIHGVEYRATNASDNGVEPFVAVEGTSVAAPLDAGLVATIDHTLLAAGDSPLGFLNPQLYQIANEQYAPIPAPTSSTGVVGSPYGSMLPTLPFYDVVVGGNRIYPADPGYDLVTGWGVLDAYNYTMYVLQAHSDGVFGRLSALEDEFDLSDLKVSSTGAGAFYNASIQQNFFLASSLGAPVYWIQNVVYVNGTPGAWALNFTGWVVWPFFGLFPSVTMYEYNFPATGFVETTPVDFDLTTELVNTSNLALTPTLVYSFGVAGAPTLYLPAPGAAYILGDQNYSYDWEGSTYTNGPYPGGTSPVGFLSPQFGLVGGPSLGVGHFNSSTTATVTATLEPYGTSTFYPAGTARLSLSASQTGEVADNLRYTPNGGNSWTIGYSAGSTTQGILEFEDATEVPGFYAVQFNETGVIAGATWWVNLTGGPDVSAVGPVPYLSAYLANGTYPWTASIGVPSAMVVPNTGTAVVNGHAVFVNLRFSVPNDTVSFSETGLTSGLTWSVNITGAPPLAGTGTTLNATLAYGSYSYTDAGPNAAWSPVPGSGTFSVGAVPTFRTISFTLVGDVVTFSPTFDGTSPVAWSVSIAGTFVNGTASNASIALPSGSYSYDIFDAAGDSVTPSHGNFTLHGPLVVDFVITASGSGFPVLGLTSLWGYLLIGTILAIVVVALLWAATRSRRSPPSPP